MAKLSVSLLVSCLVTCVAICHAQSAVIVKQTPNTRVFEGTLDNKPIKISLNQSSFGNCEIQSDYLEGWYAFNSEGKKLKLAGFVNGCDVKLYRFGDAALSIKKIIEQNANPEIIDKRVAALKPTETLIFDACEGEDKPVSRLHGKLKSKGKVSDITLTGNNFRIGTQEEYFELPNGKSIVLSEIFSILGGNKFYALKEDKTENRLLFSFRSVGNVNPCGRCGADYTESGYRLITFSKNWQIKKTKEYLTESCQFEIYDTQRVSKTPGLETYKITSGQAQPLKPPYYLVVDKSKATLQLKKL